MLTDEEWNTLPEDEKGRRRNELLEALREIFKGWDKEVVVTALKEMIVDLKKEGDSGQN